MIDLPLMNLSEPWVFAAAFLMAVGAALLFTAVLLPVLRRWNFGQTVRDDGPSTHLSKEGTPTMGGLVFILALLLVTNIFASPTPEILLIMFVTAGAAFVGFADDYLKVALQRPLGLRGRDKLLIQITLGYALGSIAVNVLGRGAELAIPFVGESIHLGVFYPVFTALLFAASTNAVNLTDGLDGLAAGGTSLACIVFFVAALARHEVDIAILVVVLLGACIGFLWHNFYPARVFMGDTGSLGLGGALAGFSVLTETELLLVIAGGLFVVETISVIMQVIFFRLTGGRRLFRMSPLHHHFELMGWSEIKTVLVLWSFQLICVIIAIGGLRGMGA